MEQQRERFDIAIVGGGAAGIAAAVAAARHGLSVCLIEASSRVGGAATNAHVGTICGLSLCGEGLGSAPTPDNPGFASEFSALIAAKSGTKIERSEKGLAYLPYLPDRFQSVAEGILGAESSVAVALNNRLAAAQRGDRGEGFLLSLEGLAGSTRTLSSRCCIDCSGDSVVSSLLAVPTLDSSVPQASAQVFLLGGLPPLDETVLGFTIRKALREAALSGALPDEASYVSLVPGSLREGSALCKLGLLAGTSAPQALAWIDRLIAHLRGSVSALAGLTLAGVAPSVGVRGGRRGVGRETLSEQAITASERCAQGVALGFWPMELWDSPVRPTMIFPEQPIPYEIPLGALCSVHVPGLYFAGRCICASDKAIASARVIGTCLSTGFAAGRAAAGRVRNESESAIVAELRRQQVDPFFASVAGESSLSGVFKNEPTADKDRRDTPALA